MFKINVLEANGGDCILISFGEKTIYNILIDGGIKNCYRKQLKNELKRIKDENQNIDLLIITHIDNDHINGILAMFEDKNFDLCIVKKIWFNSEYIIQKECKKLKIDPEEIFLCSRDLDKGYKEGNSLEKILKNLGIWHNELICIENYTEVIPFNGGKITILTPSSKVLDELGEEWKREVEDLDKSNSDDYDFKIDAFDIKTFESDTSITNRSSISFIFEYEDKKILFAGDAFSQDIKSRLIDLGYDEDHKLKLEYFKLPHHGSKKNLSLDLLNIIECDNYVISTNGAHNLPNKKTLARIIKTKSKANFYFNHDNINSKVKMVFIKENLDKDSFSCIKKNIIEV